MGSWDSYSSAFVLIETKVAAADGLRRNQYFSRDREGFDIFLAKFYINAAIL